MSVKGRKQQIRGNILKEVTTYNLEADIPARIRKIAKQEGITSSMVANSIFRKFLVSGRRDYLIWKYQEALMTAEMYRSAIVKYDIEHKEVQTLKEELET